MMKTKLILLLVALLVAAVAIIALLTVPKMIKRRAIEELSSEIKTFKILEMATVRQDIEVYLDSTHIHETVILGMSIPRTSKIGYVARGYAKAGFKLDKFAKMSIKIEYQEDGDKLVVRLPSAKLLDVKLDPAKSELAYAESSLMGPDKLEAFVKLQPLAENKIKLKALREGGILEKAQNHAEEQVMLLARRYGFKDENVEVFFTPRLQISPSD